MNKKRGILIPVVIIFLLSISSVLTYDRYEDGDPYTYALSFDYLADQNCDGVIDDDHHVGYLSVPDQNVGDDLSLHLTWGWDNDACTWGGLPLDQPGCYFFTGEADTGNPDDCAGWIVPAGEQSAIGWGHKKVTDLFESEEDFNNYMFWEIFSGYGHGQNFLDGDLSMPAEDDHAICVARLHGFNSAFRTYQCIEQQNQYRWYICDRENLYSRTGNFLPIEEVIACNPDADENACSEEYTCENDVCIDESGEPVPAQPKAWICELDNDNHYVWGKRTLECDDIADCDENQLVCENDGYAWMEDAPSGNKCCGDDGRTDFMTEEDSRELNGKHLCLNQQFVDAAEEIDWDFCGENDWCWVNAEDDDVAFHVYTINFPGEIPYDIISNSVTWNICNAGGGLSSANDPLNQVHANRFYCHKEGNKWSWSDCPDPEASTSPNNGVKSRELGDGLFALPLVAVGGGEDSDFYAVDIGSYRDFYGDNDHFHILDHDTLEFMVKFTEEIVPPANVRVTIKGPPSQSSDTDEKIIYLQQNSSLGYATNNPVLEPGRWIHVKMPLPVDDGFQDLLDIREINFEASPGNTITVMNAYLTKEGGVNKLCSELAGSGEDQNAWLDGMDFSEARDWSARKLCNLYYSPNYDETNPEETGIAWLGDRDLIGGADAERRCCGDDPEDYYAGPSENNYGCWNSEPIANRETT